SENNDIPPAYFYSASLLEQAGYRDRAVDLMEVAVNLDPENPIYRRELGRLYDLTGRRDRALEELRKSLELDPYQPQVKAVLKRLL
ncbi:MAG TPA: tetratricopeptide repeat protein, partial [candidate division WOR-3 bacterium]|nr:tetratricopeptide repeat protein [candidate division WOR-3 bacterium]